MMTEVEAHLDVGLRLEGLAEVLEGLAQGRRGEHRDLARLLGAGGRGKSTHHERCNDEVLHGAYLSGSAPARRFEHDLPTAVAFPGQSSRFAGGMKLRECNAGRVPTRNAAALDVTAAS
jgi:hypothetical protein